MENIQSCLGEYGTLSTKILTNCHHKSHEVECSLHVWKVGEGFMCWVRRKTKKWLTPCLYTVTGWGVMSCVCGMTFLCCSTLIEVPLLQAGTM